MNKKEQYKILVVDDEQDLCEILSYNLAKQGYATDVAYSAEEVLRKDISDVDLLLLDVMMEGLSGFELVQRLKIENAEFNTPIIFLTAKITEQDTLKGFGIGADDYITKPFRISEVLARIKAVLNRTKTNKNVITHILSYKVIKGLN